MDEYTTESAPAEAQSVSNPTQDMSEPKLKLIMLAALPNIVPHEAVVTAEKLSEIGRKVIEEYDIDQTSREEWLARTADAMKLAMLTVETKTYPWANAANVKYPLLTVAGLQFNARCYPAIVQGNRVVKSQVWGRDPQGMKAARGDRVSEFMSYQLLAQQPEWEEDTDRMTIILPFVGSCFRKVYYDPSLKRNTTRLIKAENFVVNYFTRSLEDTPRATEQLHLYPYEIQERILSGRFIEFDYSAAVPDTTSGDTKPATNSDQDKDAPHLFLEQHRLLDLDDDGYPEPYIVTVHHSSQKVCRIVANYSEETVSIVEGKVAAIRKQQYYVKYEFMPSPDGGFYGMGFGSLTAGISGAIDTLLNQMVDAGHQSVVQGGFVSSQMGIKEKKVSLQPGEFRVINASGDVRSMVLPLNFPGPSAVLFNLLGLLIEAGKDITGVKDVLTGEGQGKNASPTTTMALIEQGLQQFTAIYKRIHRALKKEYGILAGLNKKHVDPKVYADFFDEGQEQPGVDPQAQAAQQQGGAQMPGQPMPALAGQGVGGGAQMQPPDPASDFNEQDMDIVPVSDPAMVSNMLKLAQGEFLAQFAKENPFIDQAVAGRRVLEAAKVEKVDELIKPPPPPDPQVIQLAQRGAEAEVAKLENDAKDSLASAELKQAQTAALSMKTPADVGLTAAKTESEHVKMEDTTSRILMEHGANEKPEQTGPTPFEVQQHEDSMALERDKLQNKLELARISASAKPKTPA